jgi:hypothetical protein
VVPLELARIEREVLAVEGELEMETDPWRVNRKPRSRSNRPEPDAVSWTFWPLRRTISVEASETTENDLSPARWSDIWRRIRSASGSISAASVGTEPSRSSVAALQADRPRCRDSPMSLLLHLVNASSPLCVER